MVQMAVPPPLIRFTAWRKGLRSLAKANEPVVGLLSISATVP